jgi:hypothetical protein
MRQRELPTELVVNRKGAVKNPIIVFLLLAEDDSAGASVSASMHNSESRETVAQIGGRVGSGTSQLLPRGKIVKSPLASIVTSGSSLAATILTIGVDPKQQQECVR